MLCKHCQIEIPLTGRAFSNHVRWCEYNPIRDSYLSGLEKARSSKTNFENQYTKAKKENRSIELTNEQRDRISERSKGLHHSDETKKKISDKRKQWLQENPSLHPWKSGERFKSVTCEKLKNMMREIGFSFEEEFSPLIDRHFSLDIAMPLVKIGIEVNGEQHYKRDGSLRDYYQSRHDLIESHGWKVLELHYTECYNHDVIDKLKLFIE